MSSDPSTWPAAPFSGPAHPVDPLIAAHAAPSFAGPALDSRPVRSVLFVCTGNVCRSPFGELLLSLRAPGITVASRGTFALQGSRMDADMAAELIDRGGDPARFRSRQVSPDSLRTDLILAMGPEHLAHIRDEVPAARRHAGLLGHVAELIALVPQDRPLMTDDVVRWSRAYRLTDGSIPDPYRKGRSAAARSAALIDEQLQLLVPVLDPLRGAA